MPALPPSNPLEQRVSTMIGVRYDRKAGLAAASLASAGLTSAAAIGPGIAVFLAEENTAGMQ
jgi:hypothetical protein